MTYEEITKAIYDTGFDNIQSTILSNQENCLKDKSLKFDVVDREYSPKDLDDWSTDLSSCILYFEEHDVYVELNYCWKSCCRVYPHSVITTVYKKEKAK